MSVNRLVHDLEATVAKSSSQEAGDIVARLSDLFVATADGMAQDQVGVFDIVIGRLAWAIEVQARIDLSSKLAAIPNAPVGLIRQLALDVIAVARPVLTRSPRLTEQDLVAICATKGRDHMLAVTERPNLSEATTDFLILRGDRGVTQAVAANRTARFSRHGVGVLVMRSAKDEALRDIVAARTDLPEELAGQLVALAKAAARRRLEEFATPPMTEMIAGAVERGAARVVGDGAFTGDLGRFASAYSEIRDLAAAGRLDEATVAEFARSRAIDHVICAVALSAELSLPLAEQQLLGSDREPALMIARALGWSWPTMAALLALRSGESSAPEMLARIRHGYEALAEPTAKRILGFLQARESEARAAERG